MTTKVFVGNLAFQTTDQALAEAFQDCGRVKSGVVITRGRRSLGYGFVEFESHESALEAVRSKNNSLFKERTLKVEIASDNPVRESSYERINNPNIASSPNPGSADDNNNNTTAGGSAGADPRRSKKRNLRRRKVNPGETKSENNNKPQVGGSTNNPSPGSFNNKPAAGSADGGNNNNNQQRQSRRRRRPINNNNNNNNNRNQNIADRVLSKSAIFVANLPFNVKDDDLLLFFKDNNPKSAHVVVTRNGRSRGYGFVDFVTEADQLNAINSKNNLIFAPSDRQITVTPSYKTQEISN